MSSTADPREDITHDIRVGQVYEDSRSGDELLLVYIDSNIYVLRDRAGNHRLGKRRVFDMNTGAGRFSYKPDAKPFDDTGRLDRVLARADEYESQDGRKEQHYAEAMHEAVDILTGDESADDRQAVPFDNLDNIGQTAADNLREAGYSTKGDVRGASDEELLDVSWVGEKGVTSIREYVD